MIENLQISGNRVAIERRGRGRPLLFIHGWPLHRATWRDVVPALEDRFECILFDFPGLGETDFDDATPIRTHDLVALVRQVADRLGLDRYSMVAHDSGATVARLVAAAEPDRIASMFLSNTELPGHRPPFIRFYQTLFRAPLAADALRMLLGQRLFLRSPMGFGGCFWDLDRIDRTFVELFVAPLIRERRRALGAIRYLMSIDWSIVDALDETHRRITAPVHLIWGADDPTFPLERARIMTSQLPRATLTSIPRAKLLVHEEHPKAFASAILATLMETTV